MTEDTTTAAEAATDTTDGAQTPDSPETEQQPAADESAAETGNAEAAKYRRRLREAETERVSSPASASANAARVAGDAWG